MVIVMNQHATEGQIEGVIKKLVSQGFDVHRSTGVERTILGAVGSQVVDIRDFARQMPPPTCLYLAEADGRTHIVWIGGESRGPIPSSGPACYFFDSTGKMVDWRDETGEGHPIDRFFDQRPDVDQMTLDDAFGFIAQTAAQQ